MWLPIARIGVQLSARHLRTETRVTMTAERSHHAPCIAVVVAAGRGQRLGGEVPKQYRTIGGEPIIRHTLRALAAHPGVAAILPVIHPDDADLFRVAADGMAQIMEPVPGGAERQDSVRAGLERLAGASPAAVLIHDAARPFVPSGVITRVLDALEDFDGAIPALPVVDTLKRAGDGIVAETISRDGLWRAQTPQGFRYDMILTAHRRLADRALTDDAAIAEAAGLRVALVEGDERNFKVTTADDLARAEDILAPTEELRTGFGFDVHRFCDGDHVVLCGIEVPHSAGLEGHSDADAGLHALTDAVLGAIGMGDIGTHFPPTDETWRGAPSDVFLAFAAEAVRKRGGRIVNADVTLVCERPKIGPYRDAMVAKVAEILGVSEDRVNVKATTTEKLGFTGRNEGLAAQAVATVALPRVPRG